MKKIETLNAPKAIGPYSQSFLVNDFLYISGQIPVNPDNNEIPLGIELQTEQSCKNILAILKEANIKIENVFKTTCFLTNMEDFSKFNEIYAKYFISNPARSCVAVKELPKGVLCEIEAIAINN